jgi:hypothetical protein
MKPWIDPMSLWLLAGVIAAAGCGVDRAPRLADYLDELEFDVPLESAAYVSLGKYDIPIAAARKSVDEFVPEGGARDPVFMRLQFELSAETSPAFEKAVEESAKRHLGAMNDAVLTTVRTSTVEELADPRLAAVKARLGEIIRPMLGEDIVRQLVFNKLDEHAMELKKSKSEHAESKEEYGHH